MNRVKYIPILFMLSLAFGSCGKSYLAPEDNSVILREQYVTDINTLQQYMNGIYVSLARDFYNASGGPLIYSDLVADNLKPTSSNVNTFISHYNWNQSTGTSGSGTHMDALWKNGYHIIRACNFGIDKANVLIAKHSPFI